MISVQVIEQDKLYELTKWSGELLLGGLRQLENANPTVLQNARGVGTFCAIDVKSPSLCIALVQAIKQNGALVGTCGTQTIRFRPTLMFGPRHVDLFLSIFKTALNQIPADACTQ